MAIKLEAPTTSVSSSACVGLCCVSAARRSSCKGMHRHHCHSSPSHDFRRDHVALPRGDIITSSAHSYKSPSSDHGHSSSHHIVQDGSCCQVARPARGCIARAMIDFHRLLALVLENRGQQHSAREPYNSNRW